MPTSPHTDVELDPGQAGEVTAHPTLAQRLAHDPTVREVLGNVHRCGDHVGTMRRQRDHVGHGVRMGHNREARRLPRVVSRRLAGRGLSNCLAERVLQILLCQAASAVLGQALPNERQIDLVLERLEQPLPDVDRDNDSLGTAMRAEVDRLTLAGIEPLGDLMERVTGLARAYHLGHEVTVR